jgi:hypothetical protein
MDIQSPGVVTYVYKLINGSVRVDLIHGTELRFIHVESTYKVVALVIVIFSQIHTTRLEALRLRRRGVQACRRVFQVKVQEVRKGVGFSREMDTLRRRFSN